MRIQLILFMLFVTHLGAADYQKLTLSDGKVLVGYYDEKKGFLTLDDGSTITIKVDNVMRREPATPGKKKLDIPPPVKPPAEGSPTAKAKDHPGIRTELITLMLMQSTENLHQARRRWLAVCRESIGDSALSSAELAQRLATAKKDLDSAAETVLQVNDVVLRSQLVDAR